MLPIYSHVYFPTKARENYAAMYKVKVQCILLQSVRVLIFLYKLCSAENIEFC